MNIDLPTLLNNVGKYLLQPIIFFMFAIAIIIFLWGLFQMMSSLDNEEARRTGIKHMVWGIVGLSIMIAASGILAIIKNTISGLK